MLNFSYLCLYDILNAILSLTNPAKRVIDENKEFNASSENKTHARARLAAKGATGLEVVDVKQMGLTALDSHDLLHMTMRQSIGWERSESTSALRNIFFQAKFWHMWATM